MRRRFWATAMTLALGIAGALTLSAGPAFAVNNFKIYYASMPAGAHKDYACIHETNYQIPNFDWLSADNNCDVRVWMYENVNAQGYNICISPGVQNYQLHRSYQWIYISNNTSACGS